MDGLVSEFNDYRERMNKGTLGKNNLVLKHFWNLYTNTYEEGALHKRTKEMLGLVASRRCGAMIAISTTWKNVLNLE